LVDQLMRLLFFWCRVHVRMLAVLWLECEIRPSEAARNRSIAFC
jgi:hypothetical protein